MNSAHLAAVAEAKHNAEFSEVQPENVDASMYKHTRKNILDNDEFLSEACREVIRRYQLIEGGCLNVHGDCVKGEIEGGWIAEFRVNKKSFWGHSGSFRVIAGH